MSPGGTGYANHGRRAPAPCLPRVRPDPTGGVNIIHTCLDGWGTGPGIAAVRAPGAREASRARASPSSYCSSSFVQFVMTLMVPDAVTGSGSVIRKRWQSRDAVPAM